MDFAELSQRAREGKPLYGESDQPLWVQGAAHNNSAFSQLKLRECVMLLPVTRCLIIARRCVPLVLGFMLFVVLLYLLISVLQVQPRKPPMAWYRPCKIRRATGEEGRGMIDPHHYVQMNFSMH